MGCLHEIAKQIISQKADYILKSWWHKNEREGLTEQNHSEHCTISSGHALIETRTCQQLLIDKNGW